VIIAHNNKRYLFNYNENHLSGETAVEHEQNIHTAIEHSRACMLALNEARNEGKIILIQLFCLL